jgi:hypothetical protein
MAVAPPDAVVEGVGVQQAEGFDAFSRYREPQRR